MIVEDPLQPDDLDRIQAVADREKPRGSALQSRLSVFWGTPSTLRGDVVGGRFPALDRLDLLESGRLLTGSDAARTNLPRPSCQELIVTGAEFALDYLAGIRSETCAQGASLGSIRLAGEGAVEEIRTPKVLAGRGVRRVTKVVLFPVRFLYTAATAASAPTTLPSITTSRAPVHRVAIWSLRHDRGERACCSMSSPPSIVSIGSLCRCTSTTSTTTSRDSRRSVATTLRTRSATGASNLSPDRRSEGAARRTSGIASC